MIRCAKKLKPILSRLFNKACRDVKKLVKKNVLIHEQEIAAKCKSDPKLLFSYINKQRSCSNEIKSIRKSNGELSDDTSTIANVLNEAFQMVFTRDDENQNFPTFEMRCHAKCSINPLEAFKPRTIESYLLQLNKRKNGSMDGVHPYVLSECSISLCKPLSMIFIKSFELGKLPDIWKYANITPLYKKGDKYDPLNYRPISLTSICCKVMERILREIIMDHIICNNLLTNHQHGFVNNKSCLTNLIETLDIVTETLSRGFNSILVYLDFAKAFDSVQHQLLMHKLAAYGINGKLFNWIKEFLSNRRQRVNIKGVNSEWAAVTSGVPQGAVLSTLLFIIYINDMPDVMDHHLCKLFADDSKLICTIKNSNDLTTLQYDLDKLVDWANKWKLNFNIGKCKFMKLISPRDGIMKDFKLYMTKDGVEHEIGETKVERDLGVHIQNDLKWSTQIKLSCLKANNMIATLRRTFTYWNKQIFLKLYCTFVRPHLEYCVQAWNPSLKKDIAKLEKIQRRATKLIPEIRKKSYEERLRYLGLTTLEKRRERGDVIQYFKFHSGINKISWYNGNRLMVSGRGDGPAAGVRGNHHRIARQLTTVEARRNFITNRVVKNWNKLPSNVINSISVNGFKKRFDEINSEAQCSQFRNLLL
jgi:hypothetical protein